MRPGIIPARAGFTSRALPPLCPFTDHPRSRGVYASALPVDSNVSGSSPLARGLRGLEPLQAAVVGIIPARAGFTRGRSARRGCRTDHPRSRGVYSPTTAFPGIVAGSSPLARGLPVDSQTLLPRKGIIPARAGFTARNNSGRGTRGDHPRSRGVYPWMPTETEASAGSSPLARGLRSRYRARSTDVRIIPARAGFTPCAAGGWRPTWRIIPARAGFTLFDSSGREVAPDHPRSRGVYWAAFVRPPLASGSSPLARGLHLISPPREGSLGIIPARAGFTASGGTTSAPPRDHPRSRGVYGKTFMEAGQEGGSSPLARGLPRLHTGRVSRQRIIPARAGFTMVDPSSAGSLYGSSPLARGLHPVGRGGSQVGGIIPARAGFTSPADFIAS